MIIPVLEIYKKIKEAKPIFEKYGLKSNFFVDLFRGQPSNPEMFELYAYPAIFIEYSIIGQGKEKPRLIQLTLHLEVDESYDASNISSNNLLGMQRFLYVYLLQKIFEGKKLGHTSALKFESEQPIDSSVVDYHTLVFSFESYPNDLVEEINCEYGIFEAVDITSKVKQKRLN